MKIGTLKLPFHSAQNVAILGDALNKNVPLLSFFISSTMAKSFNIRISEELNQAAWSIFLQSSLILSIWSNLDQFTNGSIEKIIRSNIGVVIAFLFGSIGSVLGGLFGYHSGLYFMSTLFKNSQSSIMLMQLKLITSCITASYIGGTANFFETGVYLTSKLSHKSYLQNSVNAVAGIDIAVMVIYFSIISTLQSFLNKRNRFPEVSVIMKDKISNIVVPLPSLQISKLSKIFRRLLYTILPITLAIKICQQCSDIQLLYKIPGVSVLLSTLISLGVGKAVSLLFMHLTEPVISRPHLRVVEANCGFLSDVSLTLFYIIIGLCSGATDFASVGPVSLIVISTALSTHLLFLGFSTSIWNFIVKKFRMSSSLIIDSDTAIIASNACIGGSSTAASMASGAKRFDLIFPATFIGLLGYMTGTPVGLGVARFLKLGI